MIESLVVKQVPEQARKVYGEQDTTVTQKVDLAGLAMPAEISPGFTVVDLGSFQATLLVELQKKYPQISKFIGIEGNSDFHQQAAKLVSDNPKIELLNQDIAEGIKLDQNVDLISCMGVIHELINQKPDFLPALLNQLHDNLKENGRVVIRDPVLPANPDEILAVTLGNEVSTTTKGNGGLSPLQLMDKFYQYYQSVSPDSNPITKLSDDQYSLPARLMGEFLRMRTFNDTPEHWQTEIKETHAVLDQATIISQATQAQFKVEYCLPVTETNYYAGVNPDEHITIEDSNGGIVVPTERFPSHLYVVLRKDAQSKELDPDEALQYQQETLASRKKLEQILNEDDASFTPTEDDYRHTAQLLLFLHQNIDLVVTGIHDLWAAARFNKGYVYDPKRNDNRDAGNLTHPLLIPTSKMIDITVERDLALGDINGLAHALILDYPDFQNVLPSLPDNDNIHSVIQTMIVLSKNDEYLRKAAPSIHANWSKMEKMKARINGTTPDPRSNFSFDQLTPDDQKQTVENIQSDLIAAILFLSQKE